MCECPTRVVRGFAAMWTLRHSAGSWQYGLCYHGNTLGHSSLPSMLLNAARAAVKTSLGHNSPPSTSPKRWGTAPLDETMMWTIHASTNLDYLYMYLVNACSYFHKLQVQFFLPSFFPGCCNWSAPAYTKRKCIFVHFKYFKNLKILIFQP